jgi:hypothetical protein
MNTVLVAVVASYALSEMARGLLRRCGFRVVEHRSLDDARRLIEHGPTPAFVIVMPDDRRGHPRSTTTEGALSAFLDAIRGLFSPDHVIAAGARGLLPDDLQRCTAAGMRVLPGGHVSIRRLARFLMQLQGNGGTRCCASASEHAACTSTSASRTPSKSRRSS